MIAARPLVGGVHSNFDLLTNSIVGLQPPSQDYIIYVHITCLVLSRTSLFGHEAFKTDFLHNTTPANRINISGILALPYLVPNYAAGVLRRGGFLGVKFAECSRCEGPDVGKPPPAGFAISMPWKRGSSPVLSRE